MRFFEYPYVIITIMAMVFLVMGLIGLYFTMKSVRTSKGTVEKNFCGIGKIGNDFERAGKSKKNRCLVYVFISLDNMKRLYSESKAMRIYEQVKKVLLNHLCLNINGEISVYVKETFVAMNELGEDEIVKCFDKCFQEINETFVKHGAVGVARVNFGY